jgi:PAS domain S-box-containing protein
MARNYEQNAAQKRVASQTALVAASIVREMDMQIANLEAVANFFCASEKVTREEFRRYSLQRVQQEAGTELMWWAPQVPADERDAFESAARAAGLEEFTIRAPEHARETYYPIWYVEPLEKHHDKLGFDTWSSPMDRAVMERASATVSPALSAPAPTGESATAAYTFHLFAPVFARADADGAPEGGLEGFAGAKLQANHLLRAVIRSGSHSDLAVALIDEATGIIFAMEPSSASFNPEMKDPLRVEQHIIVAGRPWRVVCYPEAAAGRRGLPLPQSWLILLAGLIITGLATSYASAVHINLAQSTRLISAEKLAKQELEETLRQREKAESAQRLLAAIVEYSGEGIIGFDKAGTIISWNRGAQRIYGWEAHEIIGRPLTCLVPEEQLATHQALLDSVRVGDPVSHHEAQHQHRNGGFIEVSISLSPLGGESGAMPGISMLVRDESELRRAREAQRRLEHEVQEAQKMESLGVLAGGVAHDFNNLLTGIAGNAELLLESAQPGSESYLEASDILRAAQRAADLARQMLAYSGKGRFIIEEINLNHLITEMSKLLAASVSKKTQFAFDLADDLPCIHADATQIRQVIVNLIVNASEAMAEKGGTITLRTFPEPHAALRAADTIFEETLASGPQVCLQVCDEGSGMNADTITRVFEPFFTTKFTGRGLGLSAVQGIVRGHGGAILVESVPGEGTRFDVLLPITAETSHLGRPNEGTAWIYSGTALVADDEAAVRMLGGRMLERIGLKVICAEDGEKAVEIVRAQGEDLCLVLLDLKMPVLDGTATLHQIRALRPDLPIVITSGYAAEEAAQQLDGARIDAYLQKPYSLTRLREVLRPLLRPDGPARSL